MFNKILILSTLALALAGIAFGAYNFYKTPKLAYVRSHDLIYNYEGTKEARSKFDGKKEGWQANIDTLSSNLQQAISKFNLESGKMAAPEKQEMEKYLQTQKQQLMSYSQAIEQKAQEEDEKMMQGVLNQVNSYVEEYGKEHGYDVILGTTLSGNVLYGEKYLDITDDLLKALNKQYKGKK